MAIVPFIKHYSAPSAETAVSKTRMFAHPLCPKTSFMLGVKVKLKNSHEDYSTIH